MIEYAHNKLPSGSDDVIIKLWVMPTNQCEATLTGHNMSVMCLVKLVNGNIDSGSWNKTIKLKPSNL